MPMNFSGRSVDDASRVIEIDDVLVPTIASGLSEGQSGGEDLPLDLLLLGRRLDDEVAVAEVVVLLRRTDALERRLAVLFADALAGDLPRHVAVDGRDPGLEAVGVDIVELDVEAGERADMRDAAAHLSRADHADLADGMHVSPRVRRRVAL